MRDPENREMTIIRIKNSFMMEDRLQRPCKVSFGSTHNSCDFVDLNEMLSKALVGTFASSVARSGRSASSSKSVVSKRTVSKSLTKRFARSYATEPKEVRDTVYLALDIDLRPILAC